MIRTPSHASKQGLLAYRLRPPPQCRPACWRAAATDLPRAHHGSHFSNARSQNPPQHKRKPYCRRRVQSPITDRARHRPHDRVAALALIAAHTHAAHLRLTLRRRWSALLPLLAAVPVQHDLATDTTARNATARTCSRPRVIHLRQPVQPKLAIPCASYKVRLVQWLFGARRTGRVRSKNVAPFVNLLIPETVSTADVLAFALHHTPCAAYPQVIGLPQTPSKRTKAVRPPCSNRLSSCAPIGSLLLLIFPLR